MPLRFAHQTRHCASMLRELASVLLSLMQPSVEGHQSAIPPACGVVCFVASFALMAAAADEWEQSGQTAALRRLAAVRARPSAATSHDPHPVARTRPQVYFEPREAAQVDSVLSTFADSIHHVRFHAFAPRLAGHASALPRRETAPCL